jgi:competence ComEA-like helix-hairpin-helix protein
MMPVGRRIIEWLAFTRTEQNVLLFLVGAFVLGSVVRLLLGTGGTIIRSDSAAADSVFVALTALELEGQEVDIPFPVNINSASKAELVALPGVGEVTAQRIIVRREQIGSFTRAEDLLVIKGISKKKLERLKALITFD